MLALDPSQTFEARVRDDPAAVFDFRYLTGREYLGALEIERRRAGGDPFDPEITQAVYASLRVNLVGWDAVGNPGGPGIPFDPAHLEDVTTAAEAWELFYQSLSQGRLSVAEKNGSGSPSESSSARPAGPAVRDGAATP